MSRPGPRLPPPEVLAQWWEPFGEYLAKERRYSAYTVRNYRQALDRKSTRLNSSH